MLLTSLERKTYKLMLSLASLTFRPVTKTLHPFFLLALWDKYSGRFTLPIQETQTSDQAPPETPAGAMLSHVLGVRTSRHYTNHRTSSPEILVVHTGIRRKGLLTHLSSLCPNQTLPIIFLLGSFNLCQSLTDVGPTNLLTSSQTFLNRLAIPQSLS